MADNSKSNYATNTTETFFLFFAPEQVWDGCLCERSSALIPKEILLVTINEEIHKKENHDYLNWIHFVTFWCGYLAVKLFRDWLHLFRRDGWTLAVFLSGFFFPWVKNVKITTPGDFNLLTTLINSVEVIFYANQIPRVLRGLFRFLDIRQPFLLCLF